MVPSPPPTTQAKQRHAHSNTLGATSQNSARPCRSSRLAQTDLTSPSPPPSHLYLTHFFSFCLHKTSRLIDGRIRGLVQLMSFSKDDPTAVFTAVWLASTQTLPLRPREKKKPHTHTHTKKKKHKLKPKLLSVHLDDSFLYEALPCLIYCL